MGKKALLAFEDGSYFFGTNFGASGETFGEAVFNTSLVGYQEVLTDPSYAGQIVIMTYPEIGIYGINNEDFESDGIKVNGFVVFRAIKEAFNFRATTTLDEFLKRYNVIGIEGVDTRAITKKIRSKGTMKAAISTLDLEPSSLVKRVRESADIGKLDLVKKVTCQQEAVEDFDGAKIVVIDCGVKYGIIRELEQLGAKLIRLRYDFEVDQIKKIKPDGVLISNGPGDPKILKKTVENIRNLLKFEVPLVGICLGHQLIALAVGGQTYKMKFGHRGINHPVKDLRTQKVLITTQNHGYAVDPKSFGIDLPEEVWKIDFSKSFVGKSLEGFGQVQITHISLNDCTVEGLRLIDKPVFCVQFHPEASPGPHDSKDFFKDFAKLMRGDC
ncbi:glutamine-hydrolyzing carbamoyl-phosphate synthase small subunit [Pseudothermotoga thermarum]|uniref:Carbamoyl phosphate synthase small chain n=1 Tax=Pseudothermotoga thermarum DSM 5069 TaxID=688269 RepID=F7YXC3_9THEM|nr:glutamine-hydrolyzing carbamoyl-phosphate synthase small subunit [Pseudothermotoga thermarum]AEH51598.1 carbamoyl-phosphate synthase small subunit [Pseudothermotoga thermarum DSM 5069]